MRFLRIDQCGALWLGLAEFLVFCQTQTTESFKVRIAISWKKQGRTPKKPHFFSFLTPSIMFAVLGMVLRKKIDRKSHFFMIYNLRQSIDSNFQIQIIDRTRYIEFLVRFWAVRSRSWTISICLYKMLSL